MTAWAGPDRQMTSDDTEADVARHITITGTRTVTDIEHARVDTLFCDHLRPFAGTDAHFYVGGASGIDTLALGWLARHALSSITVVVPCTLDQQPPDAADEVARWHDRGRLSGVVELGADALTTASYHARNRWMVDRSQLVIAFPRDLTPVGGTWYTADYGRTRGLGILIAAPLRVL